MTSYKRGEGGGNFADSRLKSLGLERTTEGEGGGQQLSMTLFIPKAIQRDLSMPEGIRVGILSIYFNSFNWDLKLVPKIFKDRISNGPVFEESGYSYGSDHSKS